MDFDNLMDFLLGKGLTLNYVTQGDVKTLNAFKNGSKDYLVSFDYRMTKDALTLEKAYCRGKWELTKENGLKVTTCGDSLVIYSKVDRTCKEVII